MSSFRDRFKKANKAEVYGSGAYLAPGEGILCIKAQKHLPLAQSGETWVMEYQVVAAISNGAKDAAGVKIDPSMPGTSVSEALKIGASDQKLRAVCESKLKERQFSIFGLTANPDDEDYADMLEEGSSDTGGVSRGGDKYEAQPACGVLIGFIAMHTPRDGKEALTKITTQHLPGQTEEGIAARRAKLLAGDSIVLADCADVKIPNRFL